MVLTQREKIAVNCLSEALAKHTRRGCSGQRGMSHTEILLAWLQSPWGLPVACSPELSSSAAHSRAGHTSPAHGGCAGVLWGLCSCVVSPRDWGTALHRLSEMYHGDSAILSSMDNILAWKIQKRGVVLCTPKHCG